MSKPRRRAPRPAAVPEAVRELFRAWGSEGGKTGGKARWKGVPAEERSRIARAAVQARWRKAHEEDTR